MMIKKNDVVSVVTNVGEFVGKFVADTPEGVTLGDPRMIVHNQQGMGFAKGVSMAGLEEPDEATFYNSNVVVVMAVNPAVEKAWREFTSGIVI
jgi:hypothetical protein